MLMMNSCIFKHIRVHSDVKHPVKCFEGNLLVGCVRKIISSCALINAPD